MRRLIATLCVAVLLTSLVVSVEVHGQSVVRSPYVQQTTSSSAVIVWRTDTNTQSYVRFGLAPDALDQVASSAQPARQHELVLEGLEAKTRYYYSVGTESSALRGGDAEHYLQTSPPSGEDAPVRVWVVGDSGTGGSRQAAVRDAMVRNTGRRKPDLFVHVGDMAYDNGKEFEFQDHFFAPYADILRNTVCWPALGNHEGNSADSATQSGPYYDAYVLPRQGEAGGLASGTEAWYSFDYGSVHFVALDSHDSSRRPEGAMLTWLQEDLAQTDARWIVAFWHHPPYTKGSHDSDDEGKLIDMRENALPILEAGGVDLVLTGHSHIYERSWLLDGAYDTPTLDTRSVVDDGDGKLAGDGAYVKEPGVTANGGAIYVVAGHGGTGVSGEGDHPLMYFSEVANGSVLFDIDGSALHLWNVRWDGVVSDEFTLVKGDALVLSAPAAGDVLAAGQPYAIQWSSVGEIATVDLDLSTDGGESWGSIASELPNDGAHSWTTPVLESEEVLIRVSDAANPMISDATNGTFAISRRLELEPIHWGDTWRYDDSGTDNGEGWLQLGYDDSDWATGGGQLGYGDGDEATLLEDVDPNRPSAYFRKVLSIPGEVTSARIDLLHDDGAAVWVNGELVFSRYVEDGTEYARYASDSSADDEISSGPLSPSPFVVGDNLIAVIVKQSSAGSSDLSFDLRMDLEVQVNVPPVFEPLGAQRVSEGEALELLVVANDLDEDSVSISATLLPTGAAFDPERGAFTWTPTFDQAGQHTASFEASDERRSATLDVPIIVDNTNTPPTISSVEDATIDVGERFEAAWTATDAEGDEIEWSTSALPEGARFEPSGARLVWTPSALDVRLWELEVIANDGDLSSSDVIVIEVRETDAGEVDNNSDGPTVDGPDRVDNNDAVGDDGDAIDPADTSPRQTKSASCACSSLSSLTGQGHRWWPLGLVLTGVALLSRRRR